MGDEPPRKKRKTSLSPKRGRGRPKKVKNEEYNDDIDMPDIIPTSRARSPKRAKSPSKPKRERKSKSPAKSKSPSRRKKNEPNLGVKILTKDPTYCFLSENINNDCCIACTSKIEPLRACLTNNIELLKNIVEDKKNVSSLLLQRSV